MPDGHYPTPDEEQLMEMLRKSGGSPQGVAQNLFERLEALEAAAEELERRSQEGEPESREAGAEE